MHHILSQCLFTIYIYTINTDAAVLYGRTRLHHLILLTLILLPSFLSTKKQIPTAQFHRQHPRSPHISAAPISTHEEQTGSASPHMSLFQEKDPTTHLSHIP